MSGKTHDLILIKPSANDYVATPFDGQTLLARIENLLDSH